MAIRVFLLIFLLLHSLITTAEVPELAAQSFTTGATESRYVLSTSLTVSASTRTSDIEIDILPGGKLTIGGNIALTAGRLKLTACGGEVAVASTKTWTISEGSVIDLTNASSAVLSDKARIKLAKGAMLTMGVTPFTSSGRATVEARQAVLAAPPVEVFGTGVSAEGDWVVDCAYPQWFMAGQPFVSIEEAKKATTHPDWGAAINKAINMKNSGEVKLPRGIYTIATTVSTHYGIRLTGAGATANNSNTDLRVDGSILMVASAAAAGKLQKDTTPGVNATEPYMMTSNLYYSAGVRKQLFSFPGQPATIENILFYVNPSIANANKVCGIYSHGSINCRYLAFEEVATAIVTDNAYSDAQTYLNLHYVTPASAKRDMEAARNDSTRYAFYLQGNGDAFRFEQCSVDYSNPVSALYLSQCNGGAVVNNILNSRVTLHNCRPLTFSGNHMEIGAMLEISQSEVNVESNFFEKGSRPSVRIIPPDKNNVSISVVNLTGNQFVFADGFRYKSEEGSNTAALARRIKGTYPFDVTVATYSTVHLNQSFRNTHPWKYSGNYTSGLMVGLESSDGTVTPLDDFNKRSGYLTPDCQIAWGKVIATPTAIPAQLPAQGPGKSLRLDYPGSNSNVPWLTDVPAGNKTYGYKYCFLPEGTDFVTGMTLYDIPVQQPSAGKGVYLQIMAGDTAQRGRLYLERSYNGKRMKAYVPFCFTRIIFDNGLTVGSYLWEPM